MGRIYNSYNTEECNFFKIWLIKKKDLSERTAYTYLKNLEYFRRWFQVCCSEELAASKVTEVKLSKYQQYMVYEGKQESTINQRLSAVKKYLEWAHHSSLINTIPKLPPCLSTTKNKPRVLSESEQVMLFKAAKEGPKRDLAIMTTLLETGMKAEELCGLQVRHVGLNKNTGRLLVAQREVPLTLKMKAVFKDDPNLHTADPDGYVFLSNKGAKLSPGAVEAIIRKYARKANLTEVTSSCLRATFATKLAQNGVNIQLIAKLLGLSSLDATLALCDPEKVFEVSINAGYRSISKELKRVTIQYHASDRREVL